MYTLDYENIFFFSLASGMIIILLRYGLEYFFKGKGAVQLKHNCLMTRYPILFVYQSKNFLNLNTQLKRTIFYLKEHGYEVIELRLPLFSKQLKRLMLEAFFRNKELKNRFHVFTSNIKTNEIAELTHNFSQHMESIQDYHELLSQIELPVKTNQLAHISNEKHILSLVQDLAEKEWA